MAGSDASDGRLVIVCGLPGAGKTTLARSIEAEYGAVRLCPDEWMAALGIDLFDAAMRARIEALQWTLARRLLEMHQPVVIEWGTWAQAERDTLRLEARALGAAVELRFLDAPVDVLWERVDRRRMELALTGRAITRAEIERYDALLERPDDDELALFDPPP